jgi:hypothetical protein
MRMGDRINLSFAGKTYTASIAAYHTGGPIVLPDNTVLKVGIWLESIPPQASWLEQDPEAVLGFEPAETAKLLGGHLATEVVY